MQQLLKCKPQECTVLKEEARETLYGFVTLEGMRGCSIATRSGAQPNRQIQLFVPKMKRKKKIKKKIKKLEASYVNIMYEKFYH